MLQSLRRDISMFETIVRFDPKLNKSLVVISHSPKYAVGDLID